MHRKEASGRAKEEEFSLLIFGLKESFLHREVMISINEGDL